MVSIPEQELISSVKKLYNDPEFSDIKVIGADKEYQLHRAIICPRSKYFADQCRAIQNNPSWDEDGHLDLKADDPSALQRVVEYLYTLDYSDDANEAEAPKVNGTHENGIQKPLVNGTAEHVNGQRPLTPDAILEAQHSPREDLADNSLDDFIPPSKQPKPKKNKKKRRQSVAPPSDKPADPEADAENEAAGQQTHAAQETTAPAPITAPVPEEPTTESPSAKQTILTTHAKVYALSSKYGIPDLQASALEKFEARAQSYWDADDFLAAAKEVYNNTPPKSAVNGTAGTEEEKRTMRDAITTIMHHHSELMDKIDKVKEVGLNFTLDLLNHIRDSGGWSTKDQAAAETVAA